MIRCVLTALFTCLFLCTGSAQAILTAGDVAIVGYNTDSLNPAFAWMALTDIQSGEVIRFTDNPWQASGQFGTAEGEVVFTAPAGGVAAGAVIEMASPSGGAPIFRLIASGDQIIAYQDNAGAIVPLLLKQMQWRPKEVAWTAGVVLLEALGRLLGKYDYKRNRDHSVWDVATTTKRVDISV